MGGGGLRFAFESNRVETSTTRFGTVVYAVCGIRSPEPRRKARFPSHKPTSFRINQSEVGLAERKYSHKRLEGAAICVPHSERTHSERIADPLTHITARD